MLGGRTAESSRKARAGFLPCTRRGEGVAWKRHVGDSGVQSMATGEAPAPKLAAVIRAENTLTGLAREDRAAVVKALMQNLVETGRITKANASAALKLVQQRESLG